MQSAASTPQSGEGSETLAVGPASPDPGLPRALSEPPCTADPLFLGGPRLARPHTASGSFLRVVMVNDVYKLDNYPRLRTAVREMRACSAAQDCVVVSVLTGDFLSPCMITSLDGGVSMLNALHAASVEYVMFGNHEFDLKPSELQRRVKEYQGTWVNSNVTSPAFVGRGGEPLPEYVVLRVGSRKVALAAFLLDDVSQFSPLHPPGIGPVAESMIRICDKVRAAEGNIDAFLPMLHQGIKQDREVAELLAQREALRWVADRTPVLLGGHDHEVYIEQAAKSLIFKVGCDCTNIGIVDLWWTADGGLRRSVHMCDAEDFPPDPGALSFVQKRLNSMGQMMAVPIFTLPDAPKGRTWSTERVRFSEEPLVSFLLNLVKRSMPGVELVLLQGGNVRGMRGYPPGPFTYGDLMRELAFDTEMAILDLPGEVLEDSLRAARTVPEGAKPFFLHCDADAAVAAEPHVRFETVNGAPFDRTKVYRVAIYQFLLGGMGGVQPLFRYVREHDICPPLESCLPIKHYVIETCMHDAWRQLIRGSDSPCGAGGELPEEAFRQRVEQAFREIDVNADGFVDSAELIGFVERQGRSASTSKDLVKFLIDTLDTNCDGRIDLQEILALVR